MLLLDRYLGAHFFDTQAGGSAVIWMHFFWIFGHPEVYVLVLPAFAILSEVIPVFSRKPIFGYNIMVLATLAHWLHQPRCVGASHVHHWDDVVRERILCRFNRSHRRPYGNKNLQLAGHHVGRQTHLQYGDAVLRRCCGSNADRRIDRHHAGNRSLRLAAGQFVLRDRSFSLRHPRRHRLRRVRRHVLLVPESLRDG